MLAEATWSSDGGILSALTARRASSFIEMVAVSLSKSILCICLSGVSEGTPFIRSETGPINLVSFDPLPVIRSRLESVN